MKRSMRTSAPIRPVPKKLKIFRLQWIEQVMTDYRLSYSAYFVGWHLAQHITMTDTAHEFLATGKVIIFPSQAGLADRLDRHPKIIHLAIGQLLKHGHLNKIKQGCRLTGSNEYQVMLHAN